MKTIKIRQVENINRYREHHIQVADDAVITEEDLELLVEQQGDEDLEWQENCGDTHYQLLSK